jgi:BASS family bile acid:Na+ symporter
MLKRFTSLYPVWIVASSLLGLLKPEALTWFTGPWVVWALSLVMLGMGFTLTFDDFRRLFRTPGSLALGFLAHYTIMPLTGWGIAHLLNLDRGFALGLILVASCPSGTASNVIAFLARANVALAVMVTLTSTLLAFVMTPLWCQTLAGQFVPVDGWALSLTTLQVVVLPVLAGVFCNWKFPRAVARISPYGPLVSVVALTFIAGSIVAQSAASVIANAGKLFLAAVLLHATGFALGYLVSRLLRQSVLTSRTIAIEVGMQNGGMAAVLAKKNFPLEPMAAVPAVFSSVVQTLVGSLVAAYWRARPPAESSPAPESASAPVAPIAKDSPL